VIAQSKTVGPANLEMAIRNLDAHVLKRINQQTNHIQQSTTVLEKQQAFLAILPEVPKLFSKGAEFEVSELKLIAPEGTIEGNLQISLPQGEHSNPLTLMQKVQGKGKLRVPVEIVNRVLNEANRQRLVAQQTASAQQDVSSIPNSTTTTTPTAPTVDITQEAATLTTTQLNSLTQSGMLVVDSNYYVIEVALQQGQLQVNGKPFNPAMLKF
jgi:uncharacterized protein YdgA (DUF945 family)